LHARFTADAAFVIEVDDAVTPAKQRNRGTNFYARRVVAMIATQYREMTPGVRVVSLLDVLDPSAIHTKSDVVLFFAGHRAGVTADATVLIDHEAVAHSIPF
jgi:hypothetical protein